MRYPSLNNVCVLIIAIFGSLSHATDSYSQNNNNDKISLLFIGDIMGHDDQILSAEDMETNTYNYDDVFRFIKPLISEADIAIANFEVTLAGPPYTGYPHFSSPVEFAAACRDAGIHHLVTANNHSADRGGEGIINTIRRLDSLEIPHTGTFINSASKDTLSPLIIERNGISVALMNYTYGTNGMPVPEPVIVNMLNKELITSDILKAKDKNADIIILFLHWGTEYDTVPLQDQTDLAEYFLSAGADLIIGSHPHVLQKMERIKDVTQGKDGIVVYSLGNFVSNQRKVRTDGGSMVRVELSKKDDTVVISDAGYILTWVYIAVEDSNKKYFILPCSEFEESPDFFSKPEDYRLMKSFINNSRAFLDRQNRGIKEYIYNDKYWLLND
jgi:poly-gamma-glutamate synthesis protein (capsule biosynthesis protein)